MIGLENKTLKSERLTYRLLIADDKAALRELLSDESVTEPAGFMPARSQDEFDAFFEVLTQYNTGIAILLGETLIGYANVNKYVIDNPGYSGKKCVNIGFVIGKDHWNKGYATETLKTVTSYLEQIFDYCFAGHFVDNAASKRVIEKCGYRFFEQNTIHFDLLGRDMTVLDYVF